MPYRRELIRQKLVKSIARRRNAIRSMIMNHHKSKYSDDCFHLNMCYYHQDLFDFIENQQCVAHVNICYYHPKYIAASLAIFDKSDTWGKETLSWL